MHKRCWWLPGVLGVRWRPERVSIPDGNQGHLAVHTRVWFLSLKMGYQALKRVAAWEPFDRLAGRELCRVRFKPSSGNAAWEPNNSSNALPVTGAVSSPQAGMRPGSQKRSWLDYGS